MLGDDRGLLGEFGDLMLTRLGIVGAGIDRQRGVAISANRGNVGDDLVDATGGQANPSMPAMSRLATGTSPTRRLADRFESVQGVGRWGCGTIRGVALDLEEKFFDLGFEHGNPSEGRVEFTTQPQATRTFRAFRRSVR